MSPNGVNESIVEQAGLEWLNELGWAVSHGGAVAPGEPAAERESYTEVFLPARLRKSLIRLNPHLPEHALDEAFRKLTRPEGATLELRNQAFHRTLTDGVAVEF